MNKKTEFNDITNVTTDGMKQDSLNARDYSRSAEDLMRSVFDKIRSENQEIKKDEFYGYCIYSRRIMMQEFLSMYPEDNPFFKELLNVKGVNSHNPSAHFVECRIHIPEITGIFPFPDWSVYKERIGIFDKLEELDEVDDSKKYKALEKDLEKVTKKWYKEVLKINLYPRMYLYTEDAEYVDWGRFCKVKFTDSFPTMATGIVIKVLDDHIKVK
mgnify:CR=1 FL=1